MAITPTAQQTAVLASVAAMFGAACGANNLNVILPAVTTADPYGTAVKALAATDLWKTSMGYGSLDTTQTYQKFLLSLAGNLVSSTDQAAVVTLMVNNTGTGKLFATVQDGLAAIIKGLPTLTADATWGRAAQQFANKVDVSGYYTLDKSMNATSLADLQNVIAGVSADAASVTYAKQLLDSTTLTVYPDRLAGSIFEAPQAYVPGGNDLINTLQNDDILTGTGATNDTLNATLGNPGDNGGAEITPTLSGVEIINAKFDATRADMTLDLQDTTGLTTLNVVRISDSATGRTATMKNITDSTATNLSVNNSYAPNNNVIITYLPSALSATDNTASLTLNNATINGLTVQDVVGLGGQGFETINLHSTGSANTVTLFTAEELETLNIDGTQALRLGAQAAVVDAAIGRVEATRYTAGLANVAGSLSVINAADLGANMTINLGQEVTAGLDNTSGQQVNFRYTGSAQNDTVRLLNGMNAGDTIDGGAGTNVITVFASATGGSATGFQTLDVRSGTDDGVGADAITATTSIFSGLTGITVRNEGQNTAAVTGTWTSTGEDMAVTLNALSTTAANNITIMHGTTNNSGIVAAAAVAAPTALEAIGGNRINANLATATGTADQVTVNIVDGVNTDPVFNFVLNTNAVERIVLNDNDTESNTVALLNLAAHSGTDSSVTLTGGLTGGYFNLDSTVATMVRRDGIATNPTAAEIAAARAAIGYGYVTDGFTGSATQTLAAADTFAGAVTNRDAAVSTVFYKAENTVVATYDRLVAENFVAGAYAGNVVARFGDLTRTDGVKSMAITTGVGNDTLIFDAISTTNSGFTSGDTIAAGAGTDTLVIDGNTALLAGTPRIDIQASEWDNTTGIDVLRFAGNNGVGNVGNAARVAVGAGAYYAQLDNEVIAQVDATPGRLTVVNNDGDLQRNSESDLVLDMRGLAQASNVTFVGANGRGNTIDNLISSNNLIVDNVSMNQNMIFNGGDTDVRNSTTAGYVAGNNNTLTIYDTANVSISDLSQTSNFGQIDFRNAQAVAQTLTLTLNNTTVERLVDSSSSASTAALQEILGISAFDNLAVASPLNVDARAVTGFLGTNIVGSTNGNDLVWLNSNVGGSSSTYDGNATSLLDRVNWTGGSATMTVAINMRNLGAATNNTTFTVGATVTGHEIDSVEIVDLTNLTYATSVVNGDNSAAIHEMFIGGAGRDAYTTNGGNDTMSGGTGADTLTGGAGNDVFGVNNNFGAAGQSLASTANTLTPAAIAAGDTITFGSTGNLDQVVNFKAAGVDTLDVVTAGVAPTNIVGLAVAATNVANTTYVVYGNYAGGVFTAAAGYAAGTPDALVYVGNGTETAATTTGAVLLTGLGAALIAADFV